MTYVCHCGNTLFVSWCGGQTKCGQCGAIYQHDPMTGGVALMNFRVFTTNTTMPNTAIACTPAPEQRSPGGTNSDGVAGEDKS